MKGDLSHWKLGADRLIERPDVVKMLALAKKESLSDYTLLATAANAGIRCCEILHLKAEDLKGKYLSIVRRKKEDLEKEALPIAASLMKLLLDLAGRVEKGWLWPGKAKPCFRGKKQLCDGGHLSTREVRRRWDRYAKQLGLKRKGVGIHSLRHYSITEYQRQSKDLRETQGFAGHASPNTTAVYAHLVEMENTVKKIRPVL